ncbi:uncharacterized protein LOC114574313, partial [Exaiptasia diaphana]|uniref:Uncharacterized protein n=1 Tax=Exaiptasia diaphana TaxID=2652724 RepID=A0A913YPW7_EXADI
KRFIAGVKFIGSKLLKGITFGSYGVAFGSTVLQAIAGCKVTQPSIETDFNTFEQLQNEYNQIKEQIRDLSRLATERQIYANDTFYNYRDTRDLVRALADEQTLVLKSMGPEVLIVLNNVTSEMERIFEEANKTQSEVDVLKVDKEFADGLELGLRLTMTSAAIAIPGMKKLWTKYLKDSTVGKKITG